MIFLEFNKDDDDDDNNNTETGMQAVVTHECKPCQYVCVERNLHKLFSNVATTLVSK